MIIVVICIASGLAAIAVIRLIEKIKIKGFKTKPETVEEGTMTDVIVYDSYSMTRKEKLKHAGIAALVIAAAGYVFFKDIYICIILCGAAFFYPSMKKKGIIKKRKRALNAQFNDALYSISSSLSAGKSVEGAFKAALQDLKVIYPLESTYILKELELINRRIEMNETINNALADFAGRAGLEDISNFVDVFAVCKSTGGNLVEVIKNTSGIINEKIEMKNEIEVLVAEQRLSQKILNIMPFGLLIIITATAPDYIQPLYSAKGHLVMIGVLGLLAAAYFIGNKIMDIKV